MSTINALTVVCAMSENEKDNLGNIKPIDVQRLLKLETEQVVPFPELIAVFELMVAIGWLEVTAEEADFPELTTYRRTTFSKSTP